MQLKSSPPLFLAPRTCTNPETRPSYHSLTKQTSFAVTSATPWRWICLLVEISLLRGFHFAAPCDSPIDRNFLFIKVMRRPANAQYAAAYDTFGAVLFLETIATTFCRLRPELLHRHGLPLQLRLLPTTTSAFGAVSLLCRCLCHYIRVHAKSQESCCLAT